MRSTNDLVKFVKSQPKDRPINHLSWHLCAVGDWWHGDNNPSERDPNSWIEISEWMEQNANNWWIKIGCQAGVMEYGKLAAYLSSTPAVKQKGRK